jgi:chemotaxis protein MotA
MLVLAGYFIVLASVLGGFMMAGGHPGHLVVISEYVVIGGSALGAIVTMSTKHVLTGLIKQILAAIKGNPYSKKSYEELFKALYELFMLGRRNGMIALEEHVSNPHGSSIFSKYSTIANNHHALEFLCSGLRPVIDGKVKPDQLKTLMEIEVETMENEHHAPIAVLTKAADAMPGFGIVAAVLGIVITMGSIAGPIEEIGHHVAAALVGTFLGILLAYGVVGPMATAVEGRLASEHAYLQVFRAALLAFARGDAPKQTTEAARRSLDPHVRPSFTKLEELMKGTKSQTA